MDRTQRDGTLFILMAVLGYSFMPILSKIILEMGLPPLDVRCGGLPLLRRCFG